MMSDKNVEWLSFQARYTDKTKATQDHKFAVKLLPKINENPEKCPTG